MFKKKAPEPVLPTHIDNATPIADIERLILFMEQHHVDEIVLPQLTIRKSVHLLPEDKKPKMPPQPSLQDLIGLSAE